MPSQEVFRYVNVRPPARPSLERAARQRATYSGSGRSPLHAAVEKGAGGAADPREHAIGLARARLAAADGDAAARAADVRRAARAATGHPTARAARAAAEAVLGATLGDALRAPATRAARDAAWDRAYAHVLAPDAAPTTRGDDLATVRAFHLLAGLAEARDGDAGPTAADLASIVVAWPGSVVPAPRAAARAPSPVAAAAVRDLEALRARVDALERARTEVEGAVAAPRSVAEGPPPPPVRPPSAPRPARAAAAAVADPASDGAGELVVPPLPSGIFAGALLGRFTAATVDLLEAQKASLEHVEPTEVAARLAAERDRAVGDFLARLPAAALAAVRALPSFRRVLEVAAVPRYALTALVEPPPEGTTPAARGIQPLGVGDLLVVRQDLLGYEPGEIAHVENVMRSETRTRSHVRSREVEDTRVVATESEEESEKDLQTTDRFELEKEARRTVEQEMSVGAGVEATATYGVVTVAAHADFALSQASSETSGTTSRFAREVTDRSLSRLRSRAREERTRRVLERFEERNEHGFDNRAGASSVTGVYRWLEKRYRARLVNYGKRLMIELVVPEPAAFYRHVVEGRPAAGTGVPRPEAPVVSGRPLAPSDLQPWNYEAFVAAYGVLDVEPPPAPTVRVGVAFADAPGTEGPTEYAKTSEKLSVPPGYRCVDVYGRASWSAPGAPHVLVAGERFGQVRARDLEGIVPISVRGRLTSFHVNLVAVCARKPETLAAWQLKTFEAVRAAYERALSSWDARVAAAASVGGPAAVGADATAWRTVERTELRKGALRLLTDGFARTRVGGVWRLDEAFDAVREDPSTGWPEADVAEALVEGRIIQFFEQAFEWEQMTYRFYPYFWSRKPTWPARVGVTAGDATFSEFLAAGAARAVVPVRPGYAEAVLHYLATSEIWNGGDPPTLDDPTYVALVDELRRDAGADLDGELPAYGPDAACPCLVDAWEVRVPTTLVRLDPEGVPPAGG